MKIWLDADACPVAIKDLLFRAAIRTKTSLTLVANQTINTPVSEWISMLQVPKTIDAADNEIVNRVVEGDLVITQDIPLAAEVIALGAHVFTPRGERLDKENIGARLNMRDFFESLRASGETTGGPAAFSSKDTKMFADQLDRLLAKSA